MPPHCKAARSKSKKPPARKKNNSVHERDEIKSPDIHQIRENYRELRSQTKSNSSRGQIMRRTERVRSEQSHPKREQEEIKREEIKTFTFKFVKEVKESSIPKKKGSKKITATSTKRSMKRS